MALHGSKKLPKEWPKNCVFGPKMQSSAKQILSVKVGGKGVTAPKELDSVLCRTKLFRVCYSLANQIASEQRGTLIRLSIRGDYPALSR